jgi:hypothetical protein
LNRTEYTRKLEDKKRQSSVGETASQKIDKYTMTTYGRQQVCFVRGQGIKLWDDAGKEYLDFLAGIAVVGLGHADPAVSQAICNQALNLTHVCNLYYTEPQAAVAELLVKNSFADRVFFCKLRSRGKRGRSQADPPLGQEISTWCLRCDHNVWIIPRPHHENALGNRSGEDTEGV